MTQPLIILALTPPTVAITLGIIATTHGHPLGLPAIALGAYAAHRTHRHLTRDTNQRDTAMTSPLTDLDPRITAERHRQINEEGYTSDIDIGQAPALLRAASCYAIPYYLRPSVMAPPAWPWRSELWKPTPDDRRRELVKAGALAVAALDVINAQLQELDDVEVE